MSLKKVSDLVDEEKITSNELLKPMYVFEIKYIHNEKDDIIPIIVNIIKTNISYAKFNNECNDKHSDILDELKNGNEIYIKIWDLEEICDLDIDIFNSMDKYEILTDLSKNKKVNEIYVKNQNVLVKATKV